MRYLTLDACVRFVGAEVDGDGGELARSEAAGVGEDEFFPSIHSSPRRFLERRGRGGQGGEDGPVRSVLGALERRRCTTANLLELGHGREKES